MSLSDSLRDLQSLPAQQWLARASRTLPSVVSAVLVVAIAWQLVQWVWLLLDRGPGEESPALAAASQDFPVRKGIDVQTIVNAHLFGLPQAGTPAVQEAPQTQMNLVLSAVFAAGDPRRGLAIIGESAQAGKVYSVGAAVRPGTRLHEVYADRVILDNGGRLEALALPKLGSGEAVAINRPPPPQTTQFADNLRELAQNNPSAFAQIVRAQPVFANGVQRGYRVYPGRNRQQFARLGLRPGDLVVAINGTPLDDPQRGMEIFNTLSSSDRANLTIERNGQSQDMTLDTAQISLPDANAPEEPPAAEPDAAETPANAPAEPAPDAGASAGLPPQDAGQVARRRMGTAPEFATARPRL